MEETRLWQEEEDLLGDPEEEDSEDLLEGEAEEEELEASAEL